MQEFYSTCTFCVSRAVNENPRNFISKIKSLQSIAAVLGTHLSINQSNFYSTNVPGEVMLNNVMYKSEFNSKIDEAVL